MTEFAFSYCGKFTYTNAAKSAIQIASEEVETVFLNTTVSSLNGIFDCIVIDALQYGNNSKLISSEIQNAINHSADNAVIVVLYADPIQQFRSIYDLSIQKTLSKSFAPIQTLFLDCRSVVQMERSFSSEFERIGVIYSKSSQTFKSSKYGSAKKSTLLSSGGGRVVAPKYADFERSILNGEIIAKLLYMLYHDEWQNVLVCGVGRPFFHEFVKHEPRSSKERFQFRVTVSESNIRCLADNRMESSMAGVAVTYLPSCPTQKEINEIVAEEMKKKDS